MIKAELKRNLNCSLIKQILKIDPALKATKENKEEKQKTKCKCKEILN
jgi:hypothetical protein